MAVDSGGPIFTRDIQTDPTFEAWRNRAVHHGICSLVSIPVFVSGELDGVLTIYSNTLGQFDEVATSVLTTLSGHVGVGMERLRAAARINDALESTIRVLTAALEARDPYTAGHEASVAALSEQIAIAMGMDDFQCQGIRLAALVHDIGKIGIPTELLTKPTKLRETEMALIREHVVIGEEVLASIDFPWPIVTSVAQHHERLDGSGYPLGLKGEEISIAGRILAVADVTDAMSRPRPYRESSSVADALDYLEANRGTLFDGPVVDACAVLVRDGKFRL